ncbi:MAG: phosphoesterase, partial [Aquabacterium sp.]|nr:phosphoesterase [Aquabacterium sp.]
MPDASTLECLQLDELQVVSDLHLGGSEGFQIFGSARELAWLARQVAASKVAGQAALLVNGDFIDFLAEDVPRAFDPDGVAAKLDRVLGDPHFKPVFDAFADLLAQPRRLLIINLGNHDLELALPWVRARLAAALCRGSAAARAQLHLVTDGTGVRARVGHASVLCLHGNEIDAWNVTDHERLRRIARDRQYGLPTEFWVPNAGAQLVVEVLNPIKASYPFVDLLKPETQAVIPVLSALNPALMPRLREIATIASRGAADALRLRSGLLSAGTSDGDGDGPEAASPLPAWAGSASPQASAQVLMQQAERAFAERITPISLVRSSQADQLGFWTAAWDRLRGQPTHEVLREALECLDQDRSFDPAAADDTFRQFDARVGPEIHLLLTGHTHLARSLPRTRGGGHYFNSGTWARLMRLAPEVRRDKQRFKQWFELLGRGRMADLDAAPGVVMRLNTVIKVWADPGATHAELQQVQAAADGSVAAVAQASRP